MNPLAQSSPLRPITSKSFKSRWWLEAALLAVFGLVLLAPVRTASACSNYPCQSTLVAVGEMEAIPTNAPAILLWERDWLVSEPRITSDDILIESQTGEPVAFHLETTSDPNDLPALSRYLHAIVFENPLEDQTWYYLHYPEYCAGNFFSDPPLRMVRVFQAGSPIHPLLDAPSISTCSHQVGSVDVATNSGSCVTQIQADVLRFSIYHNDLPYWGSLVRFETLVDGQRWAISEPGAPDGICFQPAVCDPLRYNLGKRPPTVLFSRCGERSLDDDDGLEPGIHEVQVRMLIHGFPTAYPPAEFTVEIGCPAESDDPTPEGSDSYNADIDSSPTSDVTIPSDDAPRADSATNSDHAPSPESNAASDGCIASRTPNLAVLPIVLLATVFLVSRRRVLR